MAELVEGVEPYFVTEWRDPATEQYCEWCEEGSDSLAEIGRHRHHYYVHREGASHRTADELAELFLIDVAAIVTTYDVPEWVTALELKGWCDDPDNSQGLADEIQTAESTLSDVGLSVWWEDGYVIERVEMAGVDA